MATGYIRKRGNHSWQLTYDAPRGTDGKRRQRYETVHGTKRQAQARLNEILHSLNRGEYREPTAKTWRDGRADEGAGLENRYGRKLIVGSNPTLSAS